MALTAKEKTAAMRARDFERTRWGMVGKGY